MMRTENKVKLANLAAWIMIVTIAAIAFWFIAFITVEMFDLNVFTRRLGNSFFSLLGFAAVLVLCSAIVNVSLNISLIAESKLQEMPDSQATSFPTRFYLIAFGLVGALLFFLFFGDKLSREREKSILMQEASDVSARYDKSISDIATYMGDTATVGKIPEILSFLSNQKSEFPSVSVITSDTYSQQLTYLEITQHSDEKSLKEPFFGRSFYNCQWQDCTYLKQFFTGAATDKLLWTEGGDYRLYLPFNRNGKKFILLFSKHHRYGKVGSY